MKGFYNQKTGEFLTESQMERNKAKGRKRSEFIVEIELTEAQAKIIIKAKQKFENNETKFKVRKLKETSLDQLIEDYDWEQADESMNVEESVICEEEAERVRRAVACLTEKQQLLVRLCYYEGKEFQEVATILGISKSAVTQQFKTIYGQLKRILENF